MKNNQKNKILINGLICLVLVGILATVFFLPTPVLAQGGNFPNPIGPDTFEGVATAIRERLLTFVAAVAMIILIIAGIIYIFSQGETGRTELAKKYMIGAVIGLLIILGSNTILKELYNIFGGTMTSEISEASSFTDIVTKALNLLLSIVGILGIIGLIVSGIMYLTSHGDTSKQETAKKQMIYSIIGLAISIGALIIVSQIANLLG